MDNLEEMVQIQMLFHKLKLDNPVLLTYAEDGYKDQVDYQLPQGCFHMSFRIGVGILCLSCSPKTYQSTRKHSLNDRAHPGKYTMEISKKGMNALVYIIVFAEIHQLC